MNLKYWLALLLLCLFTSGCVSYLPLQRQQTALIGKGTAQTQIDQALNNATVLATHTFSANGRDYLAKHYDLLTGMRQHTTMQCSSYRRRRSCVPVIIHIPVTDPYVIVYLQPENTVFAWGMLEELSRSPDDAVSSIMPALKDAYQQALRSKK